MTRITKLYSANDLNFGFNFMNTNSLPKHTPLLILDFKHGKSYILSVIMRTMGTNKTKGGAYDIRCKYFLD